MTGYKERPNCRKQIEQYLEIGITLDELLNPKVILLTDGMKKQVLKMIRERDRE